MVVRADSIRSLTDAGWQALVDYGVRKAVDLRSDSDAANDPPGDVPIEVVRIPVYSNDVPVVAEWPSMQEAYAGLLGHFQTEFAGAVTEIARSDEPVVVHCLVGRDRTGLVCGLMLRLAGVDLETIAADHALQRRLSRAVVAAVARLRAGRGDAAAPHARHDDAAARDGGRPRGRRSSCVSA